MSARVKIRRDTTANWAAENPILAAGEFGYETDSDKNLKLGDGTTEWNDLDPVKPSESALADEAVKLHTARAINGVSFDGTGDITVTAAASTLTGTTLASNVVTSSLTAVGTIVTGVWHGTAIDDAYLATISTAGKVANSATTATANNTASAIVARDSSGDFTARNITATLFNGPAATANAVAVANVTGLLSGGKILSSLLPAIAITDTFVVASQVAMLALTAETGDVAVRSDLNKSYILKGTDPTVLGNWQELLTPTDAVLSVAGRTGAVTLISSDITDAVSTNTANRLVLRDGSGGFAAGAVSLSGALTYGGVTLSNAVTGTGNMVLSVSPTVTGTVTGAISTWSGLITASAGILINGGAASAGKITKDSTNGLQVHVVTGSAYDYTMWAASGLYMIRNPTGTRDLETAGTFSAASLTAGSATWNASNPIHHWQVSGSTKWDIGVSILAANNHYVVYDAVNLATAFDITPGANPSVAFNGAVSGMTTLSTGAITTTGVLTIDTAGGSYASLKVSTVEKWRVGNSVVSSNNHYVLYDVANGTIAFEATAGSTPDVSFTHSSVHFNAVGTTASAANAFLDNAASNNLLRSTSSLRFKDVRDELSLDDARAIMFGLDAFWYHSKASGDLVRGKVNRKRWFVGFAAERAAKLGATRGAMHTVDESGAPNWFQYERVGVVHNVVLRDHETRLQGIEKRLSRAEKQLAA